MKHLHAPKFYVWKTTDQEGAPQEGEVLTQKKAIAAIRKVRKGPAEGVLLRYVKDLGEPSSYKVTVFRVEKGKVFLA